MCACTANASAVKHTIFGAPELLGTAVQIFLIVASNRYCRIRTTTAEKFTQQFLTVCKFAQPRRVTVTSSACCESVVELLYNM